MAINAQRTTRWAFDTRITTLATNTTLGTATRHDFAAQTIYVPETSAGRFAIANGGRVLVKITVRDAETTTATDLDGIRVGIKINAVAFDDVDSTISIANSGDHWSYEHWRDVTSYFSTNDPGTASFSVQVGVAFATGAASLVNNITAELLVTYGYDSSAATWADTAVFPIQSHHVVLPTANTFVEVGTTGGTSNAPANQIRKLTGTGGAFDGIAGFTLRKRYLVMYALDGASTTTDFTPQIRFDGGAAIPRAPIEQALNTSVRWVDIYDITALSTASAHSFEVDPGGVNNRMQCVGAIDVVSYEYTAPGIGDDCFVSVQIPLENINSGDYSSRNTSTDPDRYTAVLDIREPDTITMDQCGVVLHHGETNDLGVAAPGQTARTYDEGTATVLSGCYTIVHRTDHSSSTWSLARGLNKLSVNLFQGSIGNINAPLSGVALVNYRCTCHADGGHKHNRTLFSSLVVPFTSAQNNATATPDEPVIVATDYTIQGVHVDGVVFGLNQQWDIAAQRAGGEDDGVGWWRAHADPSGGMTDNGIRVYQIPCTRWFRRRPSAIGYTQFGHGGDIEVERKWHSHTNGGTGGVTHCAALFVTVNSMTFTIAGTITQDGAAVANGLIVEAVKKPSAIGDPCTREAEATTAGGAGGYTMEVPTDDVYLVNFYPGGGNPNGITIATPDTTTANIATFTSGPAGGGSTSYPGVEKVYGGIGA